MTNPLDITGTRTTSLLLPLSPDAVAALAAQEIAVPESGHVRLLLREATFRERAQFERDQEAGGAARVDPLRWLAHMLARRAEPGTDNRIFNEMVQDFGPTDIAMLTHAYLTGVLPDPKLIAGLVQQTQTGMMESLLTALGSGAPSPSSPTSTG